MVIPVGEKFIPVRIEHIIGNDANRSFDLYIRRGDRYMLYCAGKEKVKPEMWDSLRRRDVSLFYIESSDRETYGSFLGKVLGESLKNPDMSIPKKAEIATEAVNVTARAFFEKPDVGMLDNFKQVVLETTEFVLSENAALTHLIALTSFDFTTYTHSVNVGLFSLGFARLIMPNAPEFMETVTGFFLHDVGKTSVPKEILNKNGPLSDAEWVVMRRHPEDGAKLLESLGQIHPATVVVTLQHHERINGSGYPFGLSGDDIHLSARICAIADTFDALTAERPYKQKQSTFTALQKMKLEQFANFDPVYFERFVKLFTMRA